SCRTLGAYMRARGVEAPAADGLTVVGPTELPSAEAIEKVAGACAYFSGSRATVAVITEGGVSAETRGAVGLPAWSLVIDFDPATDTAGAFHEAGKSERAQRLVTAGQPATFGR